MSLFCRSRTARHRPTRSAALHDQDAGSHEPESVRSHRPASPPRAPAGQPGTRSASRDQACAGTAPSHPPPTRAAGTRAWPDRSRSSRSLPLTPPHSWPFDTASLAHRCRWWASTPSLTQVETPFAYISARADITTWHDRLPRATTRGQRLWPVPVKSRAHPCRPARAHRDIACRGRVDRLRFGAVGMAAPLGRPFVVRGAQQRQALHPHGRVHAHPNHLDHGPRAVGHELFQNGGNEWIAGLVGYRAYRRGDWHTP
jgi:hypothetical protein